MSWFKQFDNIGKFCSIIIGFVAVGVMAVNFWDDEVVSHAEAGAEYLSKQDYQINRAEDDVDEVEDAKDLIRSNIGKMEGAIAQHRIAIVEQRDGRPIHEAEIIRLEQRVKEEQLALARKEEQIEKKEAYISCLEKGDRECDEMRTD